MPRNTYTFPTPSYEVTFLYKKKRYPKHHYYTQAIHIMCQPYVKTKAKYCAQLHGDSRFSHFEDVQEFVKYIRKNKRNDIVDLDQQGYLTILVKGRDIATEVQSINIQKISHIVETSENPKIFDHLQQQVWARKYEEMMSLKTTRTRSKAMAEDIHNQAVYFTLGNLAQNQINKEKPTFSCKTTRQSILEQGFKLNVSQMHTQKLVLGISYKDRNKPDEVSYWCSFHLNNEDDELSIKVYDQLKIYIEDNCIVIMNANNKNGRFFSSSRFDCFEGNQCNVFVSLVTPEI